MEVKIKVNDKRLAKRIRKLQKEFPRFTKLTLDKVAIFAMGGIKKRSQEKSMDMFHKSFPPYSEAYAKRKGSAKVDLTLSGRMWNSMSFKSNPKKTTLFFRGKPAEYAEFQHFGMRRGGKISKPRPFFGISQKQEKSIVEQFANEFRKRFHL